MGWKKLLYRWKRGSKGGVEGRSRHKEGVVCQRFIRKYQVLFVGGL